jgi:DNA repair protein RadA
MGIFSKLFPKASDDSADVTEEAEPAPARAAEASPPHSTNDPDKNARAKASPAVPSAAKADPAPSAPSSAARLTSAAGGAPVRAPPRPAAAQQAAARPVRAPAAPKPRPPSPSRPDHPPAPPIPRSAMRSSPEIDKADPALIAAGLTREAATPPRRRSSRRPPAPLPEQPATGSGILASIADTFERLLSGDDVDSGFAALERRRSDRAPPSEGIANADLTEVRELFANLAANHVRQVRDFMIDVRWGQATTDWIEICEPAILSLRRASDRLAFPELSLALDKFCETLRGTRANGAHTIEGERRDAILAGHALLAEIMPQAFALDLDRSQRETVILQALLAQIPDVRKVTIDKLYAAGLTTLEAMLLANAADIVATTGIEPLLAERIVERFRVYREQVKAHAPDPTRLAERERIKQLLAMLRLQQGEYDRLDAQWSKEASVRKKELRQARAQTLNDINVILARLGEVDVLHQLERASFEQKVVRIESFLREATQKYEAQGPG